MNPSLSPYSSFILNAHVNPQKAQRSDLQPNRQADMIQGCSKLAQRQGGRAGCASEVAT